MQWWRPTASGWESGRLDPRVPERETGAGLGEHNWRIGRHAVKPSQAAGISAPRWAGVLGTSGHQAAPSTTQRSPSLLQRRNLPRGNVSLYWLEDAMEGEEEKQSAKRKTKQINTGLAAG